MKNFKLLLATTAILSTGLAMGANSAIQYEEATINAIVSFASPSTAAQGDYISFGVLDPNAGGTLTVNPDSTFDGSAKVIINGGITAIQSGSIKFSGGALPDEAADAYTLVDSETNTYTQNLAMDQFLVKLALDGEQIDMYQGGDENKPSCGYVDNLTQGNASWDGTDYTLRIGGTLNLEFDEGYDKTESCSGTTSVTYVIQEWM